MKAGKVSESILKRSVLKTIKYKSDNMSAYGCIGNDAAIYNSDMAISSCVAGLTISEENLYFDCKRAIYAAINNVAAEGGKPEGMIVDVIVPEKRLESELKDLMRYISGIAINAEIHIAGGNTEVTRAVKTPVITFTVFGKYLFEKYTEPKDCIESDDSIIMTKQIGLSGTVALAKERYNELKEKFQLSYIKKAMQMEDLLDIRNEAEIAVNFGASVMHDLSRGGIYLGLWQLAEKTGKGIEVLMDKIDINQETIEICELYGINPYKLMSNGALLIVTKNSDVLIEKLNSSGIDAKIIGKLTDNNDKVILKNEDRRYIEPPKRDELEIFLN